MSGIVFRLELRRSRALLFWLALATVLYGGLMAAHYPQLSSDAAMIDDIVQRWPKEMLTAFGISNDLGLQGTYFSVYVLSMIWPVVAGIGAILVATRAVAADNDAGFLEISVTTPISRTRYLISAIVGQLAILVALAIAAVGSIVLVLALVGVPVDLTRYAVVAVLALAFACVIASSTTLLAVLTLSRAQAGGAIAGVLLIMYLMQTASKLVDGASVLARFSLFGYFSPAEVIDRGAYPIGDLLILSAISVACWAAAAAVFRRRALIA